MAVMSKQTIVRPTYTTNNIQLLPDVVKNQAVPLKQTFDKASNDIKTYLTSLVEQLDSDLGAASIGYSGGEADNVYAALDILFSNYNNLVSEVYDGTITTSGWVANTGYYSYKKVISATGVTVGSWVEMTIDNDYVGEAVSIGLAPTVDEGVSEITIYAQSIPTINIPFKYVVFSR